MFFSTDLNPENLREKIASISIMRQDLNQEEWETALALLKGSESIQQKPRRPTKRDNSKSAWLRQTEQKMKEIDLQQHKVAVQ